MKRLAIIITAVYLTALLPVAIMELLGMGGTYTSDFTTQLVPFIVESKRMFASGAPLWSWNTYLGDNFIGSYSYYTVGWPAVWLCCLFPLRLIGVGIMLTVWANALLTGITAMAYLRRMGFVAPWARAGALMYVLSSFYIIGQFYFIFALGPMLFPLLLLAIERLLQGRRRSFALLAAVAFVCTLTNYYLAAISFLAAGLYTCFRANLRGVLRTCAAILLGVLMASVLFLPTVMAVAGSSRSEIYSFSSDPISFHVGLVMRRLCYMVAPRLTESHDTFLGSGFSSISLYVPVIGMALAAVYALRHRRSWLTWLLAAYLLIYFTPLNLIFTLGGRIDYSRWGYAIILMAILASLHVAQSRQLRATRIYTAYFACVAALIGGVALLRLRAHYPFDWVDYSSLALLLLASALFLLWLRHGASPRMLTAAVAVTGTLNLMAFAIDLHQRPIPDVPWLHSPAPRPADSDFEFRTDVVGPVRNSSLYSNTPGITGFHSVFNKAINDLCSQQNRLAAPTHHRESAAALLSVRRVVRMGRPNPDLPTRDYRFGLTPDDGQGTYLFDYYVPMGFTYTSYVPLEKLQPLLTECADDSASLHTPDFYRLMLSHVVLAQADADRLLEQGLITPATDIRFDAPLDSLVRQRRTATATGFRGTTRGFTAQAPDSPAPRLMWFSVPADPGFTATVDGRPTPIISANLGMSAIVVPQGPHSIEFRYMTPGLKAGAIISLLAWILWLTLFLTDYGRDNLAARRAGGLHRDPAAEQE